MPMSDVITPAPETSVPPIEDSFSFTQHSNDPDAPLMPTALWAAVERYQRLMERQLERELSTGNPTAWATLVSAIMVQQSWHEESLAHVRALYAQADEPAPDTLPIAYLQAHLAGAMADAYVQLHLGTLTVGECTAIERCFEALLASEEPAQAYRFMRLELAQGAQHAPWNGAVAIQVLAPLAGLPTAPRVLMYRFGLDGGWSAHTSNEALLSEASTALGALPDQQVALQPALFTAFEAVLNERVSALLQPDPSQPQTRAEREQVLIQALDDLTVPVNTPRLLALARVEEIRRSLRMGEEAQAWLARLPAEAGSQLARLITDYASAIGASDRLIRRDLPARQAYAAREVAERLEADFGLTEPCRVRLKVPERVIYVRDVITGSGAPGTPFKRVPTASAQTELIDLETLALGQIDDSLAQRLSLMNVQLEPSSHPQREALMGGITVTWLRKMVTELDVAGTYERLLADVYLRAGEFRTSEDDENTVVRPFALMLEMHWIIALARRDIDERGRRMLIQACHASTTEAWNSGEFRLVLRPAALTVFDAQTHSRGSTLAGVSLIQDQASGTTVLYLPQAPNGQTFRQYPSLIAATEALGDLFLNEQMRRYLCERALEGNPRQLENLVDQALIRGFRNLIDAGGSWPAHQSLARNQYLAELGLKVSAHRASSTSNADQRFNAAARSGTEATGYIRIALGFVPFIGSIIALADAVQAGIELGDAVAAGDSLTAIEATESVLLSIADVFFDLGPAALAGGAVSASLKATTKARQLRQGLSGAGRLRQLSSWSAQRANEAFRGYERAVRLSTRPGTQGRWRNVYQEAHGNFIIRGDHIYAVEWDDSLRTWRLAATRTRHYRQPVVLDEAGNWQTHGHLYGSLVNGGLHGGGGIQSYVADRLDPLWPEPLRRLLPRWWTDAHFRRQQQLMSTQVALGNAVLDREDRLTQVLRNYSRDHGSAQGVIDRSDDVIMAAERFYDSLVEYRALARGQRAAEATLNQSRAAATLCAKSQLQIKIAFAQSERLFELVRVQRTELNVLRLAIPDNLVANHPAIMALNAKIQEVRDTLLDLLKQYDLIEQNLERLATWRPRVTVAEHRAKLQVDNEAISRAFPRKPVTFVQISLLLDAAPINDLNRTSWVYMRRLFTPARERFDRVVIASYSSDSISLGAQQRQRLKQQVKEQSQAMLRTVQRLLASYPDQFDAGLTERLLEELRKLRDGTHVPRSQPTSQPAARGPSAPRVFEADGLLLVGHSVPGEPGVLVIPGVNNQPERWTRNAQHQWVQAAPAAPAPRPRPLSELVNHAEARLRELPAYRQRLHRYAQQRMLPADLEDLYLGEAQELEYRIKQLREADPHQQHGALIERLQQEAEQLRTEGRVARITQCKNSIKPTGGQLDYLVEAGEVQIRKVGALQRVGTSPATRNWLQEYEIIDSETGQAWAYAHFHYRTAQPRFDEFVAAHLKTPTQRLLTATRPGDTTIWRGEISRQLARKLFQRAFN